MIVQKYRAFQKGRSVIWEVMVSVIVRKKFVCTCVKFLIFTEMELFASTNTKKIVNDNKQRKITYCVFNVNFN